MSFNPQEKTVSTKDFKIPDEGMTLARCARVIEMGTQETSYGDKKQVVIWYSLPFQTEEFDGEEKQLFIRSKPMKISSWRDGTRKAGLLDHTDALNKDATSFDDILNKPCMLNIIHNKSVDGEKVYANIASITPVMAGQDVPELDTEPYYFDFYNPTEETWGYLSDYVKGKVQEAKDFPGSALEALVGN